MLENLTKKLVGVMSNIKPEDRGDSIKHSKNKCWVQVFKIFFLEHFRQIIGCRTKTVTRILTNFIKKLVGVVSKINSNDISD